MFLGEGQHIDRVRLGQKHDSFSRSSGSRSYTFVGDINVRGEFVRIDDEVEPYFDFLAARYHAVLVDAVKYAAAKLRKQIKADLYEGKAGHETLAERGMLTRRGVFAKNGPYGRLKTAKPYGLLRRTTGFFAHKTRALAFVGWLSRKAAEYGGMQQAGYDSPVTPAVRHRAAAMGIHLKEGDHFHIPARPVFGPAMDAYGGQLAGWVLDKSWEKIEAGKK